MTSFERNANTNNPPATPAAVNPNQNPLTSNQSPLPSTVKKEYNENGNKKNQYRDDISNTPGGFNTIDADD